MGVGIFSPARSWLKIFIIAILNFQRGASATLPRSLLPAVAERTLWEGGPYWHPNYVIQPTSFTVLYALVSFTDSEFSSGCDTDCVNSTITTAQSQFTTSSFGKQQM